MGLKADPPSAALTPTVPCRVFWYSHDVLWKWRGTLWACVMVTRDRCNWLQHDSVRWRVRNVLHQFKQKSKQSVSEAVVIWFFVMLCWRKPWWADIKWDVVWGCEATARTLERQLGLSLPSLEQEDGGWDRLLLQRQVKWKIDFSLVASLHKKGTGSSLIFLTLELFSRPPLCYWPAQSHLSRVINYTHT